MTEELKPCPFCGLKEGENAYMVGYSLYLDDSPEGGYCVACPSCKTKGPYANTVDATIKDWNRRCRRWKNDRA